MQCKTMLCYAMLDHAMQCNARLTLFRASSISLRSLSRASFSIAFAKKYDLCWSHPTLTHIGRMMMTIIWDSQVLACICICIVEFVHLYNCTYICSMFEIDLSQPLLLRGLSARFRLINLRTLQVKTYLFCILSSLAAREILILTLTILIAPQGCIFW